MENGNECNTRYLRWNMLNESIKKNKKTGTHLLGMLKTLCSWMAAMRGQRLTWKRFDMCFILETLFILQVTGDLLAWQYCWSFREIWRQKEVWLPFRRFGFIWLFHDRSHFRGVLTVFHSKHIIIFILHEIARNPRPVSHLESSWWSTMPTLSWTRLEASSLLAKVTLGISCSI